MFSFSFISSNSIWVRAQNPLLFSGNVYDETSRKPLEGVHLKIISVENGLTTLTQQDGIFTFELVSGTFPIELAISHLGYESRVITVASPADGSIALKKKTYDLKSYTVTAYESNNRRLLAAATGSIASLIYKNNQTVSFVEGINTISGVKMEMKSMGSYRISIRGSLLRSPFLLRNIKMYWNNIPITDAGGENPINNISPTMTDQLTVIKGPASSLYGAGTGGVLLFGSTPTFTNKKEISTQTTVGSFGLRQFVNAYTFSNEKQYTKVEHTRRHWDGYRQHEDHDFNGLNMVSSFKISNKQQLSVLASYADIRFQIAGAIDSAAVAENPRQFGGLSQAFNAEVDKQRLIVGLAHEYQWNKYWQTKVSASSFYERKENPFGNSNFYNGYKFNSSNGYSLRALATHKRELRYSGIGSTWIVGVEYNNSQLSEQIYDNNFGVPAAIEQDNRFTNQQLSAFSQWELSLPSNFLFTVGGSFNLLNYQIDELLASRPDTSSYRQQNNLPAVWSPRVGISKQFNSNVVAHASMSWGYSPPLVGELTLPDGSINTNLQAEQGINYELGVRGNIRPARISFDVNAFYLDLDNEILGQGEPVVYFNAGKTRHWGVEASLKRQVNLGGLIGLKAQANYAYHNFTFVNYGANNEFRGMQLPGISPHSLSTFLQFSVTNGILNGFYANATSYFYSDMPLNNANTVFADAYTLLNGKLGYNTRFNNKLLVDVFFGLNNMIDVEYTAFHALNAFGGRYFNPSPSRNWYSGCKLAYRF